MRLCLILLISTCAFAEIVWDDYRVALKKLTTKSHQPLIDYSRSRRIIIQNVHLKSDNRGYFVKDVYCNEYVRKVSPTKMPSHTIINIEHTWPQSRFSRKFSKSMQKSDLHHLYPTNNKANSTRGNYKFTNVSSNSQLRGCDDSSFGYSSVGNFEGFEPPSEHKGNVARAIFYFSIRYDLEISSAEESVLRMWNLMDPVDSDEMKRNDLISSIQGNRNPFIDNPEYAELISNF
ncbi:MAG: endonuclease [Bacteriovoracaceae bacterium]|nr:endonuclease [Bacteriovoracaceae bacterium]